MAKSRFITFGRNLGLSLRDIARAHRTFRARRNQFEPRQNSAFVAMAKTPEDGIPARSGVVFSAAECTFAYLNEDDELTDGNENETELVYNPYYFDIPGEFEIDIDREVFSGRLLVKLKGGFIGFLGYGDTITARSGSTLGSGTVSLFGQSGPTLVDLSTPGQTCYNTSQMTPASSEIYIQMKISAQGYLLWDVDDCYTPP